MKKACSIFYVFIIFLFSVEAQELPIETEQQLENTAEKEEAEVEDDFLVQQLQQFRKNPVNLNSAGITELRELLILNDWQISQLLAYRKLLGSFISIYELQAVPGWSPSLIRRLAAFVTIALPYFIREDMKTRLSKGTHMVLWRSSLQVDKTTINGSPVSGEKQPDDPLKLFFRYRYSYKDLLQFGVTAEKDAGEAFFKSAQRQGFDFYSFHLFARRVGLLQAIAIGDFTVNMGQGLIHWQGMAFKKSAESMNIKRQSAVLRPYNSAGEFNFHRGAGITIRKARFAISSFVSLRKLSASIVTDSAGKEQSFSAFRSSGYHRTESEQAGRNKISQTAFGAVIQYQASGWQLGVNAVGYRYSLPQKKAEAPYNLYALRGDNWYNLSIDYSYTWKNLHFFGELATDKNFSRASVNGLLLSVDRRLDFSLLYRKIEPAYQSVYGNAFTESSIPTNETGVYAGISFRPFASVKLDMYADIYRFPWLRFGLDAPGYGKDFLVQVNWTGGKRAEWYMRYKHEAKDGNQATAENAVTNATGALTRQSWRMQANYKLNTVLQLRNRVEAVWYNKRSGDGETGFLFFSDWVYKPGLKPLSATVRLQYFETDGYASRLYAYENDVLYAYSIPAFSGLGFRYYLIIGYDISKRISCGLRWAQTFYNKAKDLTAINSEEIRRSELRLQILFLF